MKILQLPFTILTYFGIWMPFEFNSEWKKYLYNLLSFFVLFTMYTFVGSQLIEVSMQFFEHGVISETLYLLLTTSSSCYKALVFLIKKKEITFLRNMLLNNYCSPRNYKEKAIEKKADKVNRCVTWIGVVLVSNNILAMVIAPLFQTSIDRNLPYKTWLPYSIQNPCYYRLSYVHQTLGLLCCGSVSLAIDGIITGFLMQVSAQFEILEQRFNCIPERVQDIRSQMSYKEAQQVEKIFLVKLLRHHDYLYLYAKNIMTTFGSVIFVQFCASAMVIIFSIYQLAMSNSNDFDYIKVLLYLTCTYVEFFLYCWFGNEVNLKSIKFSDAICETNWIILNLQSWKMMLLMIQRSSKPIVISCYNMVFLSLDVFVKILKLSYSSYNILRKSNEL